MNSSKKLKLSIIIPAYNEENTVGQVLQNLYKLDLPTIQKEILVVDDGSKDKTASIVKKFEEKMSSLRLIQHAKNKGKGSAVQTGIRNATGDIVLIQDADLEYNPLDIPKLLKPILSGKVRVVYGTRLRQKAVLFGKNKTPLLLHFFGNKFLSLATTVLYGRTISDMETGYKVIERSALKGIKLKAHSFDFEPEITAKLLKRNIKIEEIDIQVNPRGYDEGKKIRPGKDGVIALWTLLKYRFVN